MSTLADNPSKTLLMVFENGMPSKPVRYRGVCRECCQQRRYTVRRAVTTLNVDEDDMPVVARCTVEFQHQAGLADAPGCEHQHMPALVEVLPQLRKLVVTAIEIVTYYRLADDVAHEGQNISQ